MSQRHYFTCDEDDTDYDGARAIVEEERLHIERWRGGPPEWGLALSGGGIRSASYSLGVMQALANDNWLESFDYLSTVSGGGYTGASISYLLYQSARSQAGADGSEWPKFDVTRKNFPYLSNPMVSAPLSDDPATTRGKGELLRHLRENAKYLTPGRGVTFLSFAGVLIRNSVVGLIVHVAALLLLLQLIFYYYRPSNPDDIGAGWVLVVAVCALGLFAVMSVVYVLASSRFEHVPDRWSYSLRRFVDVTTNGLFALMLAAVTIGVLPYIDQHLPSWLAWAMSPTPGKDQAVPVPRLIGAIVAIVGVLGNVRGYFQTRAGTKPKIPTGLLVAIASSALLFGVLLILFDVIARNNEHPVSVWGLTLQPDIVLIIAFTVFLVFGLLPDINYVSIHRYYRDRLMETFMPDWGLATAGPEERTARSDAGNETPLGRLCGANASRGGASSSDDTHAKPARGPYHLINANAVLVSSNNVRYRGRGGDSFILSPLFTGSRATGWERTDPSQENGISLATAMAISGAAISPNAGVGGEGVTRQPVLSVLMSLFNLRMGYWLANPNPGPWKSPFAPSRSWAHPSLIYPGLFESFGRRYLNENERYVLLTDGGHFENLGLYELVRRRLKLILVCDGTADPSYTFSDLANAIEKVRADFGALVEIRSEDLRAMVPTDDKSGVEKRAAMSVAERGYLLARIRYARRQATVTPTVPSAIREEAEETGLLIYLNTTFFKGLRADLYGYRRCHPQFPDEPTGNQFFGEKEFEAYRELGFQTALQLTQDLGAGPGADDIDALLVRLFTD